MSLFLHETVLNIYLIILYEKMTMEEEEFKLKKLSMVQ